MHRILFTYTSFVIACVAVIAAFITATSYAQLTIAILLYPVLIYFAYRMLPLRARKQIDESEDFAFETVTHSETEKEAEKEDEETDGKRSFGIADIDKRMFLKLIGGAGVTLFLFSLFNKKAENSFLGNRISQDKVFLEDLSGNKINPAENQPTDGYTISEIDDDAISFYGYTNKIGNWFIMKVDSETGSFRYAKGEVNFPSGWNSRKKLSYDYYNNVF